MFFVVNTKGGFTFSALSRLLVLSYLFLFQMCPVSMKAHTTRVKLRAFVNDNETQLVFLDTPGLVFPEEVKKLVL